MSNIIFKATGDGYFCTAINAEAVADLIAKNLSPKSAGSNQKRIFNNELKTMLAWAGEAVFRDCFVCDDFQVECYNPTASEEDKQKPFKVTFYSK